MKTTLLNLSNANNLYSRRTFNSLLVIAFIALANISGLKAQSVATDYSYSETASTPAYTALGTGKSVLIGATWNTQVVNTPIGFTFKFNGINYTSVNVSANGFITFGATAPAAGTLLPISGNEAYAGAISGYGADLSVVSTVAGTPQPNSISKELIGTAGSRILKIEYAFFRKVPTETTLMNMQIWLYETSNNVQVHYNTSAAFAVNSVGQVGLRGASNTDFNNREWLTGNFPTLPTTTTAGAVNTASVRLRNANSIPVGSNRTLTWTPVTCLTPSALATSVISSTSASVSWVAPTPAPSNNYQIYYTTSAAVPTSGTTPTVTGATSPTTISGLLPNTTYYVYVRSDCAGPTSGWTSASIFTTYCTAVNIPYFLYFDPVPDGFTVPALPLCTSRQQLGTGNLWLTDATVEEGFFDEHLVYNQSGTQNANVWFYTKGINLVAGSTYRLSYTYGGSTNFSFITNKMEIAFGTAPLAASMTTQLANHPNIKSSPIINVVNFTASSTGVFYFGFRAYSDFNNGKLFLDDIEVTPSVCIRPTAATISSIGYNSATASWTAPTPVPASGYAYYLSTSPTTPAGTATPTGFTSAGTTVLNLTGLTGNTVYYLWIRGNCGSPDNSEWSPVVTFTTTNTPPYCTPSATNNTSPITNVTTTNAFTNVNNSSGYVAPGYSDYTSLTVTESQAGTLNFSVGFNASGGVGVAIWVDWNSDGTFDNNTERVYNSGTFLYVSPIAGSFTVPAGTPLGVTRMRVMTDWNATSPTPCAFAGGRGEIEDYSFNVVVPPPPLTISLASSTQCASTASPLITLTTPISNFNVYSWLPNTGVVGDAVNGWTITSGSTITYTLTGTQTGGAFSSNSATYTFFANPLPTPITITAANGGASCQSGPAIALTATGGVVSGVPVFSDNFNTGAPGWTVEFCGNPVTNTACSGDFNTAKFTLRPNNYNPAGFSWGSTIVSSNDASTFFFANGDVQSPGNANDTKLVSPVFSLAGYTAASLSFWHFYRQWSPSTGKVEISIDGGSNYTTLVTYTPNQGTTTAWVQAIIDLNAYVNTPNLRLRFNYQAVWGWGWGVDNVVVSGSATSAITWTPTAGLWQDAAANIPYIGGGAQTVYALPSTTTTYTASASTPSPTVCTTSSGTTVTVTPIVGGTVSPPAQTVCGGPTPLVTVGFTGTISEWQYSTVSNTGPWISIPLSASATLTAANIGSFAGTRYYRAVNIVGGCIAYSTTAVTVTYSSTTWNSPGAWSAGAPSSTVAAIFNFAFTGTSNLSTCSVVVNSGVNVVFNSGRTLTVQTGVTVLGTGTLTFNSTSATGAASLLQVNDAGVNSGPISFKRTTTGMRMYDYTYWSSPVFPQTPVGVSPLTLSDKYFRFDTAANTYINVSANSLMTPGQGYIIRAPQNFTATPQPYTATFNGGGTPINGVPNNGVINVPIVVSGLNVLNLIGNPYPSGVNINSFMSNATNSTKVGGTIYLWTHNTAITNTQYTGSDYAVYNYLGGTGTAAATNLGVNTTVPNGIIAAAQGFFIKGINTGGTAIFNNSMRVGGTTAQFFRINEEGIETPETSEVIEKHRIWLELKNNEGAYKQTLIGYAATATDGRDRLFDGDAVDGGNVVALYSLLDADALAIQGRSLPFNNSDVVPIGYKSNLAGGFEINLADFDGLFASQDIFLDDKLLNVIHNLKSGSYAFSTLAGTFNDRFELRYTNSSLGIDSPELNENAVIVYKNSTGIHINSGNIIMKSIKIIDMRGRLIFEKTAINENEALISNLNIAEEVLIVHITLADNKVINKKIVY